MSNPYAGLTVPIIDKTIKIIVDQAERQRRSLTPAEYRKVEELEYEKQRKLAIKNEAALAAARKAGRTEAARQDQARRDAASPRYRGVVSRSNNPDRVERSDEIKRRHARLKGR
jgi:hypothetical protein